MRMNAVRGDGANQTVVMTDVGRPGMTDYLKYLDTLFGSGRGATLLILILSMAYLIFVLLFWVLILMKVLNVIFCLSKVVFRIHKIPNKKSEPLVQDYCNGKGGEEGD